MEAGTPDLLRLEDLRLPGQLTGRKHVLSITVENKPGVLARVAGLFSRRGFNIDTLSVGPTDDPSVSRITLTLDGAVHPIDQVTKQLHKLVNVLKIRDMEPEDTVAREMALFKVSAAVENRAEIIQYAEIFRAKIVDVARRTMTIEVTGSADKIEAFERMVRPHGLVEMVRTGAHADMISHHNGHHPEIDIVGPEEAIGTWYLYDDLYEYRRGYRLYGTAFYRDRYVKHEGSWKIRYSQFHRLYEIADPLPPRENITAHYLATHGYKHPGTDPLPPFPKVKEYDHEPGVMPPFLDAK